MPTKLKFVVEVDLEKQGGGPFVTKEELAEAIVDEITSNMPADVSVGESTYEVVDSNVEYTK